MKKDQDCIKRLTGDGLSVKMDSNHRVLEVTGDGCKITLTKNCGSVRVVGDGCRVKIAHNVGDIVYTGDGGRVFLGPKSSKESVRYFGDGGKVTFDSEPRKRKSSPRKEKLKEEEKEKRKECKPRSSTILKNYLGMDKETGEESPEAEKRDKGDNTRGNARKATVFVTTRFTSSNEPKDLFGVEKWFVAPNTVIRSYVNDVPTVTVGEKKSTTNSKS